jgi:hypothetical protein
VAVSNTEESVERAKALPIHFSQKEKLRRFKPMIGKIDENDMDDAPSDEDRAGAHSVVTRSTK